MKYYKPLNELCINTIRTLSIDAIERANAGHPGMPMGAAPMAFVLWSRFLKHNPSNPHWFDRDRFVLSAGHGSMLLYSLLHLSGYDLSLEELKNFRQWGSKTPGHPEYGHTPGVEATTGPLGQGIGMAVGMAMAEAHLAAVYNKEGCSVIDHYTYVLCGDGDLMEGVSSEAASLAGHLGLGKLIMLYDSNDISLDGSLDLTCSEKVGTRFEALGWQYLRVKEQNDLAEISAAIAAAKSEIGKPTIIEVKTTIGYGSPNKAGRGGHAGPHGNPLGKEETLLTKQAYGWPLEPGFHIPKEVKTHFAQLKDQGENAERLWNDAFKSYRAAFPEEADQLEMAMQSKLPDGWETCLPVYSADMESISTRTASGNALNALAGTIPMLIGGSADLASSNYTTLERCGIFRKDDYKGRNIWFGVREFAMGTALNGMMLHGGLRVFGGTFLVFSDYLRPSIRLAALMKLPLIYVFTHDSIAVGEDGPTHQPVEQLASLRIIPGLTVIRPADANEASAAWSYMLTHPQGPCALILSRQNLPVLRGTAGSAHTYLSRGGYVLSEASNGNPQAQIIATGSEVSLALEAQNRLASINIPVRVISMPSRELFQKQPQSYKDYVILPELKARIVIEMASSVGWEPYAGEHGFVIGMNSFGASGKADRVMKEYGFTVDQVMEKVLQLLE